MQESLRYVLSPVSAKDFDTVFSIKKNALGKYIEQTWGWDEELQRKMQLDELNSENISIIETDGTQIGTVGINEKENEVVISRLYITDKFQSKGIGSKIISDIIVNYPGKKIRLGVLTVNQRAKELYERLGFKVIGEENNHYKMEYNKNTCLNCGAEVAGKYCPNCGQKTSAGRIDMKHILHDFFHVFTHVDSGILYLIKEQFLHPGVVVREYVEGKRKKYFSPSQYLFLGVAVATFFTVNLDLGIGLFGDVKVTGEGSELILHDFLHIIYKFFNVILLITVPFIAAYTRIFFRKSGYNFAELLTLSTFVSAQRHVLFLLGVPFIYFFKEQGPVIAKIVITVWASYFVWTYLQFFRPKNYFWAAIKASFVCFLFLVTNGALVGGIFLLFFRHKL